MGSALRHVAAHDDPGSWPGRTDRFFVLLTRAADRSRLWIVISAPLLAGGPRARRGAVHGLVSIAVTSAATNIVLKRVFRRARPGRRPPLVPLPASFSFPSGHSASAFAFVTAVSRQLPGLAPLLLPLAAGVAYSRVRTGVHHRGDVLLGSAVGVAFGLAVTAGPRPPGDGQLTPAERNRSTAGASR